MRLKDVVTLGDKVDVEFRGKSYRTRVENVEDDETVVIWHPTEKSLLVAVPLNEVVQINLYKSTGLYCFDAVCTERFTQEALKLLRFKVKSDLRKHQRREGFRLNVLLNIDVEEWVNPPRPGIPNPWKYQTKTVDISEGGLLLITDHNCYIDTKMDLTLTVKGEQMLLVGRVKRCVWPTEKGLPYKVGIQFEKIPSRDQQIIAKFILETQLKQRR